MRPVNLAVVLVAFALTACSTPVSAERAVHPPVKPAQAVAPQRPAGTREVAAAGRRSGHADSSRVSAMTLADRFGLKFTWLDADHRHFALASRGQRLEFELDSRDSEICGLRVFLGDAVRLYRGVPSFSRTDADLLITPILRPGYDAPRLRPVRTIVLDAGHGGKDTGLVNPRLHMFEKTLTLDTVLRLKRLLEAGGYRVVLTRSTDRFVELADRPEVAERCGADLFVSVHFNAVESGADHVTGVETYTMTPQGQLSTDRESDQFVKVANPGNENDEWNTVLGAALHRAVLKELRSSDRGLKRGRLAVLRLATCPAALIESAYLSNDAEARKLATPAYRDRIAGAIADGIKAYAIAVEAARRR